VKALAIGLLVSACATQAAADGNPLHAERWQTRPLVVVSPTTDHPLLQDLRAQLRVAATRREFEEREMVLFTVVAGQGQRAGAPLSTVQTRHLLGALGTEADSSAQVFLIGKDGGIKLRVGGEHISLPEVFSLIDSMPMRRR